MNLDSIYITRSKLIGTFTDWLIWVNLNIYCQVKKLESNTAGMRSLRSPGSGNQKSPSVIRRKSDQGEAQFSKCDVCGETGGVTNTVT